ncbi:MAG TPA: hypothetical protein VF399_02520 [bacterium]
MRKNTLCTFPLCFALVLIPVMLPAQNDATPRKPELLCIFIDCEDCDLDFMKTEIDFVNHVTDRAVADLHILITTQETASGGTEYTIIFFGQGKYAGMTDTMTYIAGSDDSEDTIRRGLAQRLKIGLMRYVAQTPVADNINIAVRNKNVSINPEDRWHNWIFSIGIDTYLNGEKSYKYNYIFGSISANRTTESWKLRNEVYYDYTKTYYAIDETTTIPSLSKSYGVDGLVVKSFNDHWSAGLSADIYSSTYSNIEVSGSVQPAMEYDIFPYRQATSREIRVLYNPGLRYYQYFDTTIYDKTTEIMPFEYLSITLDTKQRWGSVAISLSGRHFLPDYKKNRLTINADLSLPVVKGLAFTVAGWASLIHDQISLPKRGLTPEEILLRIRQQATQYQYYSSIGLKYSFGSRYSNIVNPRFGD